MGEMKHMVITGAADGIGKALAAAAIDTGYTVTGIDVDAERAQTTQTELGEHLSFIIADLSQSEGLAQVAGQLTGVDVMVHNAGINEVGYFESTDPVGQQQVISLNLQAPLVLTRHLLANEALNEGASLVFVSSLSRYIAYPGASVYAATKDGIAAYARSLAVGYPHLHVMTVYPGPTRTAHARRYSPDNSREDKRMAPADLAGYIMRGIDKRQRIVIPGGVNLTFAALGRWLPALTDRVMRTSLLEKFDKPPG